MGRRAAAARRNAMKQDMSRAMFHVLLTAGLLALSACSTPKAPEEVEAPAPVAPDEKVATYKGYEAINQLLRGRLVSEPSNFQLSAYLGSAGPELAQLL